MIRVLLVDDQALLRSGLRILLEAQEDIRDGHYWTTWPAVAPVWYPVPDEVVIKGPNKTGRPVVWTYWENGSLHIRCYAPGGGV